MKRTLTLGALALSLSLWAAPQDSAEASDATDAAELETLRSIGVANVAMVADLCDLVTIDLEEMQAFETATDRCDYLAERGIISLSGVDDIYSAPATHGAVAKAAILTFELERSLMFRLTGTEWYAVQNAETLEIVPEFTKSAKTMSGEELLAIMGKARELAEERDDWGIEKNVYEEFGYSTYEEVDQNYKEEPAAAAAGKGEQK